MVLVFGVATMPDTVHHTLSNDASACLAMEVFRAEPSTHYLTSVIDKVCVQGGVACVVKIIHILHYSTHSYRSGSETRMYDVIALPYQTVWGWRRVVFERLSQHVFIFRCIIVHINHVVYM